MKIRHHNGDETKDYKFHAWAPGQDADYVIVSDLKTGQLASPNIMSCSVVFECKDCRWQRSAVCTDCKEQNLFEWKD